MAATTPEQVIAFWFDTLKPRQWFRKDVQLDKEIAQRFGDSLTAAGRCELWRWRSSDEGRLAEIIVLDQFSRNIHRDTPQAFANDPLALALAQEAVARGVDRRLEAARRAFVYMPYMHSESLAIHAQALALFDQPGLEDSLRSEHQHHDILQRFGRYPHRNAILGRISSAEELAFLATPGSSF
ncbi:DUF924 family protein [Phytohalomonas tamaricis]|uniref:DUF924 family protein n=1 Tax=Phytohalomonas tamaricis TaxID=2081032 RepID=UPI000D0B9711|nr:DUF924 family protein [Phytohalomonas tamaricis]